MVDVIVDRGREQIVGQADRVKVTRKVEIDLLHRENLGVATSGGATLHAETGPERRLAETEHRLFADRGECVSEPHGCRRLAFTGRGGAHGGDENQLAVATFRTRKRQALLARDLGDIAAVTFEIGVFKSRSTRDFTDRLELGILGNFDIGRKLDLGHEILLESGLASHEQRTPGRKEVAKLSRKQLVIVRSAVCVSSDSGPRRGDLETRLERLTAGCIDEAGDRLANVLPMEVSEVTTALEEVNAIGQ